MILGLARWVFWGFLFYFGSTIAYPFVMGYIENHQLGHEVLSVILGLLVAIAYHITENRSD